jgi:hypothetical protein
MTHRIPAPGFPVRFRWLASEEPVLEGLVTLGRNDGHRDPRGRCVVGADLDGERRPALQRDAAGVEQFSCLELATLERNGREALHSERQIHAAGWDVAGEPPVCSCTNAVLDKLLAASVFCAGSHREPENGSAGVTAGSHEATVYRRR